MVTRHILEQTRRNGDDIAAVKTKLDRVEIKLDGVKDSLGARIDTLAAKVYSLIKSLPKIVGDSVRDVLNGPGR